MAFFVSIIFVVLKLVFARELMFEQVSMLHSIWVELPVAVLLFVCIESFVRRIHLRIILLISVNFLVSVILFSLLVYYQYFGAIATYSSLVNLNQVSELGGSILTLIKPSFWLLLVDIPFLVVIALVPVWRQAFYIHIPLYDRWGRKMMLASMLVMFISGAMLVNHVVKGAESTVTNELTKAKQIGLLNYELYAAYEQAFRDYVSSDFITPEAIREIKQIKWPEDPNYFGIAEGKDVYVVQLESFQRFLLDVSVEGQEVTPNLNQLIQESVYFDHYYQQIGKGNTSDAEFISNTSLYPTGVLPMSSETGGVKVPSLPRMLGTLGYQTLTFHTNEAKFWDRNQMYPALGFHEYIDQTYFGKEDMIAFGASDEVLYDKAMEYILQKKEESDDPLYVNLISMSCHNPFELPEDKPHLKMSEELEGSFLANYIQSCHYADLALGQLIDRLKQEGLWEDAVFVVYGDHFGFPDSQPEEERKLAADLIGIPTYTKAQMFNIPLIIKAPQLPPEQLHHIGGQVDLMPTLANLLGIDLKEQIIFGQDLLNHTSNLLAERVYLPSGSFINESVMMIPSNGTYDAWIIPLDPFANPENFDQSILDQDYERALQLVELSDSYIHTLKENGAFTTK